MLIELFCRCFVKIWRLLSIQDISVSTKYYSKYTFSGGHTNLITFVFHAENFQN